MPTMTQADVDRKGHVERLPVAIHSKAHAAHHASEGLARVRGRRQATDEQHPDFVSPTAMQRVGHYIRLSIYPANYLAEATAGAASAMFVAATLLKVPSHQLWMAPLVFGAVVLALEMGVAHARESGRDGLGGAPIFWTGFAIFIVIALVGLQAVSQATEALKPVLPGGPVRSVSDLAWYERGRIAFVCMLLGALHVAVLFGGRASENAIAYLIFRIHRRVDGVSEWRQRSAERAAMTDLARLVTSYHAAREAHRARGFDAGQPPAYDGVTLAALERLAREPQASAVGPAGKGDSPAPEAAPADEQPRAADSTPPAAPGAAEAASPPDAPPVTANLEDENAYLRSALDARVRDDDGEVRAPAR